METSDDNDTVDEATAVRRPLTAACAAVEDANFQGLGLAAMIFLSEDSAAREERGRSAQGKGAVAFIQASSSPHSSRDGQLEPYVIAPDDEVLFTRRATTGSSRTPRPC
jgi:hypothetical protein